jgi:chromosome segregation ATPase
MPTKEKSSPIVRPSDHRIEADHSSKESDLSEHPSPPRGPSVLLEACVLSPQERVCEVQETSSKGSGQAEEVKTAAKTQSLNLPNDPEDIQDAIDRLDEELKTAAFAKMKLERENGNLAKTLLARGQALTTLEETNARLAERVANIEAKLNVQQQQTKDLNITHQALLQQEQELIPRHAQLLNSQRDKQAERQRLKKDVESKEQELARV